MPFQGESDSKFAQVSKSFRDHLGVKKWLGQAILGLFGVCSNSLVFGKIWGMETPKINPIYWRLDQLLTQEAEVIHQLARASAGTLTSYRLVLGRCLLALEQTRHYREFGCSSPIHYATLVLGLSEGEALAVRRVARRLLALPRLTQAAENGTIAWSKLREITVKASADTEEYWLELAKRFNSKQIQILVSRTPKGSLPGEVDEEPETCKTELRCPAGPEVFHLLEQARRVLSADKTEVVTTAEVLEWALNALLSQKPMTEELMEKCRAEVDKDLQAQQARQVPLVWQAREVALEMGLMGPTTDEPDAPMEETLAQALGLPNLAEVPELSPEAPTWEERDELVEGNLPLASGLSNLAEVPELFAEAPTWKETRTTPCLENERLRYNPLNRFPTKGQRKELHRRDGFCCQTPGCSHRIWLHLHHLRAYRDGGATDRWNLVTLCSSCHRNVHADHISITRNPSGELIFKDRAGQRLDRAYDLEVAGWIDFWFGWSGGQQDSYRHRLGSRTWAMTAGSGGLSGQAG